jgi:uncharacterized HhH-GPD family protein
LAGVSFGACAIPSDMPKPRYPFTPNPQANDLLADSADALLIGLCLEQQVRSEKAMAGPFVMRERLGHLNVRKIAAMRPSKLEAVFKEKPAIHRFPGMMARRVQALCAMISRDYAGAGARVWERVTSAEELYTRLRQLPGFGDEKAACGVRILAKFGHRKLSGWDRYASDDALPWLFEDGVRITGEAATPTRDRKPARRARAAIAKRSTAAPRAANARRAGSRKK